MELGLVRERQSHADKAVWHRAGQARIGCSCWHLTSPCSWAYESDDSCVLPFVPYIKETQNQSSQTRSSVNTLLQSVYRQACTNDKAFSLRIAWALLLLDQEEAQFFQNWMSGASVANIFSELITAHLCLHCWSQLSAPALAWHPLLNKLQVSSSLLDTHTYLAPLHEKAPLLIHTPDSPAELEPWREDRAFGQILCIVVASDWRASIRYTYFLFGCSPSSCLHCWRAPNDTEISLFWKHRHNFEDFCLLCSEVPHPQTSARTIPTLLPILEDHCLIIVFKTLPDAKTRAHAPIFLGCRLERANLIDILLYICLKAPAWGIVYSCPRNIRILELPSLYDFTSPYQPLHSDVCIPLITDLQSFAKVIWRNFKPSPATFCGVLLAQGMCEYIHLEEA